MVIRDDNYSDAFVLEMYTIQEAYNQNKILNHINKLICFEEGNIKGLVAVNESVADSIKNFLKRIVDFIKKTCGSFKERIAELVTTDKKFFEKYKDVIEKNPFKKHMLNDWYEYNTEKLNEIRVPQFDFNKIQSHMSEDKEYTEETFINDYLSKEHSNVKSRIGANDNIDNVKELVEFSIRGDETKDDVDMSILDKGKIIKFVKAIDATQKVLDNDQNTLMSNQSKIESIVMKKLNSIKSANEKNNSSQNDDSSKEPDKNKEDSSDGTKTENAIDIFNTLPSILELQVGKVEDGKNTSGSDKGSTAGSVVKKDVNKVNGQDVQNQVDALGNTVDASGNATSNSVSNKEAERIEEATTQFFKSCSEILTTKLNMTIAIYKDYMKILRIHVRDYVGGENGNDNTSGTKENAEHQSLNVAGAKLPGKKEKKIEAAMTSKDTYTDTVTWTVKYLGQDAVDKFEDKMKSINTGSIDDHDMFGINAVVKYYSSGAGAAYRDGRPLVATCIGGKKGFSVAVVIDDKGMLKYAKGSINRNENPF